MMHECINCHKKSLVWCADFDFADYEYEGEGVVSVYKCSNCGAEVVCKVKCYEDSNK